MYRCHVFSWIHAHRLCLDSSAVSKISLCLSSFILKMLFRELLEKMFCVTVALLPHMLNLLRKISFKDFFLCIVFSKVCNSLTFKTREWNYSPTYEEQKRHIVCGYNDGKWNNLIPGVPTLLCGWWVRKVQTVPTRASRRKSWFFSLFMSASPQLSSDKID